MKDVQAPGSREGDPPDKAATKAESSEPEEKRGSPLAPGLCQDPLEQRCQDRSQQDLVQSPAPPFTSPTVSPLSFSVCKMGTVSSHLTRLQEDPGMEYINHQAPRCEALPGAFEYSPPRNKQTNKSSNRQFSNHLHHQTRFLIYSCWFCN